MIEDTFEEIDAEEKKDRHFISNYLDIYAKGEDIFSAAEVDALQKREQQEPLEKTGT